MALKIPISYLACVWICGYLIMNMWAHSFRCSPAEPTHSWWETEWGVFSEPGSASFTTSKQDHDVNVNSFHIWVNDAELGLLALTFTVVELEATEGVRESMEGKCSNSWHQVLLWPTPSSLNLMFRSGTLTTTGPISHHPTHTNTQRAHQSTTVGPKQQSDKLR